MLANGVCLCPHKGKNGTVFVYDGSDETWIEISLETGKVEGKWMDIQRFIGE